MVALMLHFRPSFRPYPVALSALLLAPGFVAGATPDPAAAIEVQVRYPENLCLGGIEDGKLIVDESQLENPFRQTTRLGCQVDGGDPRTMPDLPAPSPQALRLV
jgi:hypothetical protein